MKTAKLALNNIVMQMNVTLINLYNMCATDYVTLR